jgi:hypothetical protein
MTPATLVNDPAQFGRVAVLLGGTSSEREVSLDSGRNVLEALQRRGVAATPVDGIPALVAALTDPRGPRFDRVFNILHGNRGGGEDGVRAGGFGAAGAGGVAAPGAAAAPVVTHRSAASLNQKLPDDFTLAPTGRRSNVAYDVRHVWVTVIVDSQQLPTFFDNLAQVNFMTVLKLEITDEDEYKAAQQGYIYGSCDAVKIQMLVETIWLRDWTTKWMPQAVLSSLMPAEGQ